jgi:hypothetical protein
MTSDLAGGGSLPGRSPAGLTRRPTRVIDPQTEAL